MNLDEEGIAEGDGEADVSAEEGIQVMVRAPQRARTERGR